MAYSPIYGTAGYNPNWLYQPSITQPQTQQQTPARSFVTVPSEMDVQNYPIAPGNCVLFQIESDPSKFIEKTMGFSSLDKPVMRRFKLVEDKAETKANPVDSEPADNTCTTITKAEYEELRHSYAVLKDEVDIIRRSISLFTDKGDNHEHE